MPGCCGTGLDAGADGRPSAGRIYPCGLHSASPDRGYFVSGQGDDLRPAVQGILRNTADHWVSAVTSAIEIEATRAGLEYIPAARILAIKSAQMAIPLGRQKLIPDKMFAIKYPDGYRAFALEVDRGTEPVRSAAARKSLKRSLEQYQEVLKQHLHQKHYGLKCKLAVFWIFTSATRQAQFLKLLDKADKQFLSQSVSSSVPRYSELAQSMRSVVCI